MTNQDTLKSAGSVERQQRALNRVRQTALFYAVLVVIVGLAGPVEAATPEVERGISSLIGPAIMSGLLLLAYIKHPIGFAVSFLVSVALLVNPVLFTLGLFNLRDLLRIEWLSSR
ncbi:MAG TPA: hypothetical protein VHO25_10460, partial [Polyangiaceae bacterium]|nr:hypothetical protein [Polyangiaceae bacterium]